MSRKKRVLQKRFVIFCEGDTEYNYIDKMRKKQGVELVLKPINMHGGGYSNFLQKIKTESQSNYLAKFIIVDADRLATVQGELKAFKKLLEYCRIQNAKGNTDIYNYLNSEELSYQTMLEAIHGKDKLLSNKYEIKKKNFEITIKETLFNMDLFSKKSSNIEEFFDVIDW